MSLWNKTAEKYLSILDGSYKFDPVVSAEQREWWRQVARRYFEVLVKVYT